jgi:hypothetical protein
MGHAESKMFDYSSFATKKEHSQLLPPRSWVRLFPPTSRGFVAALRIVLDLSGCNSGTSLRGCR